MASLLLGDFATARVHFDEPFSGRELSPRHLRGPFLEANFYPIFRSWALWATGYSDRARRWIDLVLSAVEKLSRPVVLANANACTAVLCMFLRAPSIAQQYAEAAITIMSDMITLSP
jgi:hypothetical protein